jgi:hypothetical protein
MYFLKKILIIGVIGAAVYFLMSYHYIFVGKQVKMLKKNEFTLKYTFFSVKGRSSESIMAIKDLYKDGIGQLLVDEGKMTEDELNGYKARMDEESSE